MFALFVGVLVALAAVALVLDPLIRPEAIRAEPPVLEDVDDPVQQRKELALAALKEIEFDRATGKLDDADYERMKAKYTAEALEALREADAADAAVAPVPVEPALALATAGVGAVAAGVVAGGADPVEVLVAAKRKAGGRFCTECGAPLEGKGKFCVECGHRMR